jgi:ribose transport system permease protein
MASKDMGKDIKEYARENIIYIGFVAIFIFFSVILFNKGFLTGNNLMNIARQTAMITIMAIGVTYVLSVGEIDLSIGSTVALSALVTALALRHFNIPVAIVAGLGTGALIGFTNGVLTAKVGIPSFLATLGTMVIVVGFARWITNLRSVPITNDRYNMIFGSGDIGPVSSLFIWTIVLVVIGQVFLKKTPFGRYVLATGGNRISASFTGINTRNIKLSVLTLNGIAASLAGMLYAGRLHGARYTLGEQDLMTVIAAVIIGGTSLFGGKGSVIASLIGSLIMGMTNNGLVLMGLSVDQQMIFRGVIIIAAVSFTLREKRA